MADVLTRQGRAELPLLRQLVLYFDPFALFQDASRGPARERERARAWNRARRWMLIPYVRRWTAIAAASFLALLPVEAMAAQTAALVIPMAALAVGGCVALTVAAVIGLAWFLL